MPALGMGDLSGQVSMSSGATGGKIGDTSLGNNFNNGGSSSGLGIAKIGLLVVVVGIAINLIKGK